MFNNKYEDILEAIKTHLREQRQEFSKIENNQSLVLKYNDNQNRITLAMISKLEQVYDDLIYKQKLGKI